MKQSSAVGMITVGAVGSGEWGAGSGEWGMGSGGGVVAFVLL